MMQGELFPVPAPVAEGQRWQDKRNRDRIATVVAVGLTTEQGEPAVKLKGDNGRTTQVAVGNLLEFWRRVPTGRQSVDPNVEINDPLPW